MERLEGRLQNYAWGSRHAIAALQHRDNATGQPEAELWLGAHPSLPSTLTRPTGPVTLDAAITERPVHWLGDDVVSRYGPRMPFLVKVLAAEQPLSLQVHPEPAQAAARWEQGHPAYTDAQHKPELLVALQPFDVLCGFRDLGTSAAVLEAFGLPRLDEPADLLAAGLLRQAVQLLMNTSRGDAARLIAAAAAATVPEAFTADQDLLKLLAARYPDDPAVLVALLLNRRLLAPGEAIWMPAGNLHAYLHGVGIEVMASSDNVLRAGLTTKPVDVPEVLQTLRYDVLAEPVLHATTLNQSLVTWQVPAEEFALWAMEVKSGQPAVDLDLPGLKVILSTGRVWAADDDGRVDLAPGQAALARAGAGRCTFGGDGRIFVASTSPAARLVTA